MGLKSIYVRARDGGLYKDPALSFREGFLHFLQDGTPELVVWLSCEETTMTPADILRRVLGSDDGWAITDGPKVNDARPVPGTSEGSPNRTHAAAEWKLAITRRIPKPTLHDGTERKSRIERAALAGVVVIIDRPGDPRDADDVPV